MAIVVRQLRACQNNCRQNVIVIVQRNFVSEVLRTGAAVTLIMLAIFLVIRTLGFLRMAALGEIPLEGIVSLVSFKLLSYMDIILPLMLYLAILLVFGRWRKDNELTVLAASGIGLSAFLRPAVLLMILALTLVGGFTFFLSPLLVEAGAVVETDLRNRNDIGSVIPGMFVESQSGRVVYFVEKHDEKDHKLRNLFAYASDLGTNVVVIAATGHRHNDSGSDYLVLNDGVRYDWLPGTSSYRVTRFESYGIRIRRQLSGQLVVPLRGWETAQLIGAQSPQLVSELYWRISKVVMMPALILFALAASAGYSRRYRVLGLLSALIIYFAYFYTVFSVIGRFSKGAFQNPMGLWLLHLAVACVAIYFFWRRSMNRSLIPTVKGTS